MLQGQKNNIVAVLFIAAISLTVFIGKINGQFLADDFIYFAKAEGFSFSPMGLIEFGVYGAYFRPLPLLFWTALYKLVGMVPTYYNLAILMLHIGNALLLYFVFLRILRQSVALISSCIFSVFTGHIEAVMATYNVFDIFSAHFFLITLLLVAFFLETKRFPLYLAAWIAAVLSVLSKESAVSLPVIVFAYSFFWLRKNRHAPKPILSSVMLSLPFFLAFLCYMMVRIRVLADYGVQSPPLVSLLNPKLYLNYSMVFSKLIVPFKTSQSMPASVPLGIGACILALALYTRRADESRKTILFGLVWALVTAFPTLNIAWIGGRLNYLPSIGFSVALAEILFSLPAFFQRRKLARSLTCAVILFLAVGTILNSRLWTKAWQTSAKIQESFLHDVVPSLSEPARAYFFGVPEYENDIDYFFVGLSQCFALLDNSNRSAYYMARDVVPPEERLPEENVVCEGDVKGYYLFRWDASAGRFHPIDTFYDSTLSRLCKNMLFSWDLSKIHDFQQWEPANDLLIAFDSASKQYKLVTSGNASLLKSPYVGERVKYVQIRCRASNSTRKPLSGQLFWVTASDLSYDGKKSIMFPVANDEVFHTYTLPLFVNAWSMPEPALRLGLRLSGEPNTLIDLKSITLYSY